MAASDVHRVLARLAGAGATAWVDGGWGVDALVGAVGRDHADLDLVVLARQIGLVRATLEAAGFTRIVRDLLPAALAVADEEGREVDLHPVSGSHEQGGHQLLPDGTRFHYPPPVTGTIGGRLVWCVDAATQVRCHLGYEPTAKDHQDMARLREATGVDLPAPYGDPRLVSD